MKAVNMPFQYNDLPIGSKIMEGDIVRLVKDKQESQWTYCTASVGTIFTQTDYDDGVRIQRPTKGTEIWTKT